MSNILHEPEPAPVAAPHETTDSALIGRFSHDRDESAFSQLVARHGPLVMSIARRVLRQAEDQEDVFQATFLALARDAGRVRWQTSLAGWLYKVAYHSALRMRAQRAARRERPVEDAAMIPDDQLQDIAELDAHERLFDELSQLPAVYRDAILVCCLEGQDRTEAASQLGCSEMVLKGRLQRGRQLLLRRLGLHGLAVATVLATAQQSVQAAQGAITPALLAATSDSATLWASGQAPLSALLCDPRAYTHETWMTMLNTSAFKTLAIGACSLAILCGGLGLASGDAFARSPTSFDIEAVAPDAGAIESPDVESSVLALASGDAPIAANEKQAPAEQEEADILKALDAPLKAEFTEVPLNEVLESVKKQCKIQIEIDLPALAKEGVDPATPITVNAGGLSLRTVLRLIMDPLGLNAVIHKNTLLVTTKIKPGQLALFPAGGEAVPAAAKSPEQAAAEIRKALDKPTRVEFRKVALSDVVEFLKDEHEIPIQLDRQALEEEGVDTWTLITLNVSGISLRSAMRLMFEPLKVKPVFKNEVLLITTKTKADREVIARSYRVTEIVGQADGPTIQELADVIRTTIAPASWSAETGQVKPLGKSTLTITQTDDVHDEIARFLKSLRE